MHNLFTRCVGGVLELILLLLTGPILLPAATSVPPPWRQDQPPNRPYTPAEAISKMSVPEGFLVELVASEPDIVNPIAMAFDDRGRIWITESVEYPRKPAGPGQDRVKILEDTDADGRADKIKVFVDGLNIPTGVAIGYGGIWVLNAPDLLFFREDNGKAVSREIVLSGFGRTDSHELPNSLTWGPDGWLYGLNGVFNQCEIHSNNGRDYKFNCALWRIHPRTHEFQIVSEGTSNPYGVAWDREGSAIVEACHWANDHLFHFVESGHYQRQAGTFPPFTIPIGSITDHGHQKTAYCGIAYLDTDAYPSSFRERVVVGNVHGAAINMDRLQRDGATYLSKGEADLFRANDAWCMPVALKIGPDGCLYILDWYDRYHCSQDAARDPTGVDRLNGRLYRLRYQDTPRATKLDLSKESDTQLIARLASGNIYFRETAQRILTERLGKGNRRLIDKLEKVVLSSAQEKKSRLQAFWTLIGGDSLRRSFHLQLLSHSDPTFRAWAVRAAGNRGNVPAEIRSKVTTLARDISPDVQLQVAIAARKIPGLDALAVLTDVLLHCGQDKVIPSIAWNNLHPLLELDGKRMVSMIEPDRGGAVTAWPSAGSAVSRVGWSPALSALSPRMIERFLSAKTPQVAATALLLKLVFERDSQRVKECLSAVSSRLSALNATDLVLLKAELGPVIESFRATQKEASFAQSVQVLAARLGLAELDPDEIRTRFISTSQPDATRLQALEAIIALRDPALPATLQAVMTNNPPFLRRVFATLGRAEDPKLAEVLLKAYPTLDPELQPLAIELLMQRETWARKVLDAVLANRLPKGVLNANHLRKILESNDREALWAVEKAFGTIREERNPEREKVVAEMAAFLRENLGNPHRGQMVFRNLCSQCHTIYGEGGQVGPDLTSNGRASFEQLLSNVLDPSLVIGPAYQVTTVVTQDGRNLTGLIAEDNEQRVVVRLPGEGEETVPRNQVKYMRPSKLSMMPEGLESALSRTELADLFAFLALDRPPTDPGAKLIPGAPDTLKFGPASLPGARLKIESRKDQLVVRSLLSEHSDWVELATYHAEISARPYLHPVRDPAGRVVLTEDRPADHPWQHGIFTGFHRVNGFNYWKEDEGRQRFVRFLEVKEASKRVSWRSLVELVEPGGRVVLEEEDTITIHAPESGDAYMMDFDILLRAKERDVSFGKFFVGGLAVRMPWDSANPRQTHLNSNGLRGRACEQQRAQWCNVERPFNGETFGIVVFDHPKNPNFPSGWRADEQGLINPNISSLSDWSIPAKQERVFRYRLMLYRGSATPEALASSFARFAH